MKNKIGFCLAVACLFSAALGCSRFAQLAKTNIFEGDSAAKGAAAIKAKVGAPVNVISAELRSDKMELTIQSPKNPKDIDKYTFANGVVTGPEPVQVMQIGNLEMSGDKYGTTPIDDIGWANIPATVSRAIELSKLENAHVDVLTMENDYAEHTNPQIEVDRKKGAEALQAEVERLVKECSKGTTPNCAEELSAKEKQLHDVQFGGFKGKADLVLTWRLFVEGPRGRKDFWADKSGKLNEQAF